MGHKLEGGSQELQKMRPSCWDHKSFILWKMVQQESQIDLKDNEPLANGEASRRPHCDNRAEQHAGLWRPTCRGSLG